MPVVVAEPSQMIAAKGAAAWVDQRSRQQVLVSGPDARSFLQGMVTNDVEALEVGQACHVAMLTPKGSMIGDGRVLRLPEGLLVDTGAGQGETVLAFLQKYLISEDAEVALSDAYGVVSLVGPKAMSVVLPPIVGRLPSSFDWGFDVVVRRDAWSELEAALSALPQLSTETATVLRVERGVPLFGVDMTDRTIPLEANLERAIHYKKGCYIGQEVIARSTFRGAMNKRLMGLLLGEAQPDALTELRVGDKKVGWLTTVVTSTARGQQIALGYVHRDHLAEGTELSLASGGTAKVTALPFA